MDDKTIVMIDRITDLVFMSIMILQEVSGKSQDEIISAIKEEGEKTDALLARLR